MGINGELDRVIKVTGLSLSLSESLIIDDVSFSVNKRECLLLIGPNGAGKSTLLKCLSRIYAVDDSQISIMGRDINQYRSLEFARLISYLPQELAVSVPYTVFEIVMMGRYPYQALISRGSALDHEIVNESLCQVGLIDFKDRKIQQLSGGERQRVMIAACLAQQPAILLLDEPTTFLDPRNQSEIGELLMRIRDINALTLVWVTHDVNLGAAFADRIIALKKGRIAFEGTAQDCMRSEILQDIFSRKFLMVPHPNRPLSFVIPN